MHVRTRIIRDEELAVDVIDGKRTETWDPHLCVGLWLHFRSTANPDGLHAHCPLPRRDTSRPMPRLAATPRALAAAARVRVSRSGPDAPHPLPRRSSRCADKHTSRQEDAHATPRCLRGTGSPDRALRAPC